MDDEGADAGGSASAPSIFKKKGRSRASAAASGIGPSRSSQLRYNEQEQTNDDDEEPVAIRRTAGIGGRGKIGNGLGSKKLSRSTALSFGEEEATSEPAFTLKKSALSLAARQSREGTEGSLPDSLDQASIAAPANESYSASSLAALKAATPARRPGLDGEGALEHAYKEMIDPSNLRDDEGENLAKLRFGADFAQDGVPSEAIVAAAKVRRRRAAEGGPSASEEQDFVSLREPGHQRREPHPESRLQREEDEQGSGEEDFADFTGATERVALDQKAIKEAQRRERRDRQEAMELDDSDDSGKEWERAQMERIDGKASRKQREKREKSPYRPAAIPLTARLPTLASTSARLTSRVAALDSSIDSHRRVADDAIRQLQQLDGDEKRNKAEIEMVGDKEAWFRELDEFIIGLSAFLDDKMPQLESIESDWKEILVERTERIGKARTEHMTDEACLFHGVPARSLLPRLSSMNADADGTLEKIGDPQADGPASSPIREARRAANKLDAIDLLSPADQTAFQIAQGGIQRRLRQVFDDVNAPEFLDPASRLDGRLHPSSLVARFIQWRNRYPEEYANAYGGLTLAGIWDFWVRWEVCGWDLVKSAGSKGLDSFHWHRELTHFASHPAANGSHEISDQKSSSEIATGGDDEVISHVISTTFIPRILDICEANAFDPWSSIDCRSMVDILEQISYVLERDNIRFQAVVSTFLHIFEPHIDALIVSLSSPAVSPPPSFDPRTPVALLSFLERTKTLLFNLVLFQRYISISEKPFFIELIDRLVGRSIWNLLVMAKDTGGKEIAQDILHRCVKAQILKEDVRGRLAALAG